MDVAVETGDPMGEAVAEAARGGGFPLIERLVHLCEGESRRQAVPLRELALLVNQEYLAFLQGHPDRATKQFRTEAARAANNLALRLLELERREEALAAVRQGVDIWRELTRDDSELLAQLAAGLANLGLILWEGGHPEEALAAAREAADLHRRLPGAADVTVARQTASNLLNLGLICARLGRREEALEACRGAVDIRRRLAGVGNAARAELAAGLDGLAASLQELGKSEEALQALHEAVSLRRDLAEGQPESFVPALAESLLNLGTLLSNFGFRDEGLARCQAEIRRLDEALAVSQRGVELHRRLAESFPGKFRELLATDLHNLSVILFELGQSEKALQVCQEAVGILRELVEAGHSANLSDFARSLAHIGSCLQEAGRPREARAALEEAIGIYRELSESWPVSEAVAIWRPLADRFPESFRPLLAAGLGGAGLPAR